MKRILLTALLASSCVAQPAVERGKALFESPSVSSAGSNPFRCATCHEVTAPPTGMLPGYTLFDAAARPSYWGGFVNTLLGATNQCVTSFMRGAELTPDADDSRALFAYLISISPASSSPALPLTVVRDIVDVPSGDAALGADVYRQACAICHGEPGSGAGRISDDQSRIPDDTLAMFGTDPVSGARAITIEKVRHGKFYSVGGDMPLFSIEALSDVELGHVLAYLETFGLPPSR